MEFFDIGLTLALIVCAAGLVWRVSRWFADPVAEHPRSSVSFFARLRAFLFDVLLLGRAMRTNPLRALAHGLVFFGFMGLLLFHAMDDIVTVALFSGYEPTLDPWQFLRNVFGLMVLLGLALMVWRRFATRSLFKLTRFQDGAALLVVAGIVCSGFALEAVKLATPQAFDRMTYEYFVAEEGRDLVALKTYWAKEYGVIFPEKLPSDIDTFERGRELDEESCVDCHSNTRSAFVSRSAVSLIAPLSQALSISGADEIFWYVHIAFCLVALAALPFGKFLHPVSTTVNLLIRQGRRDGNPQTPSQRQIALDACTRCGECSLHCSVAPAFHVMGNPNILPSEKILNVRHDTNGDSYATVDRVALAEGSRICTECLRCTEICPSGINLQDLWINGKKQLGVELPDPNDTVRSMDAELWADYLKNLPDTAGAQSQKGLADNAESFWACVQCTTCTSVCPVVAVSEDPTRDLDLAPQQIMNLLRMGLKEQALGARMVWSCTTCYKCQEHCPQNIRVADVLYELRNTVAARLRDSAAHDTGEC